MRMRMGLGLIGLTVLVLMVWVGFNAPNSVPGRSYYTLTVQFDNADNITSHSAVRMGGRLIGQALDPRVENGRAMIDLQLKPDAGPLRSDTRVLIRPRSLVGVRYIDVVPGTHGAPLADHGVLSPEQTSSPVGLDQVLDTLDPRTRLRARTLLQQLGGGVLGRGEDVNETLAGADPLLARLTAVTGELARRPGATGAFVTGGQRFAGALEPVRGDLAGGLSDEARALRPFSAQASSLRATLEQAPQTLQAARGELPEVRGLVDAAGGLARDALPVLGDLPSGLRHAARLLVDSRPTLRQLPATLRLARAATPDTLTALAKLRSVLPAVDDLSTVSLPVVEQLARRMCDIKAFAGHWANMNSWGDSVSNYLRFDVFGGDQETLFGMTPTLKKVTDAVPTTRILQNPYPAPCTAGPEGVARDEGGDPPDDGIPSEGVALP